jgi:hypothetical protein
VKTTVPGKHPRTDRTTTLPPLVTAAAEFPVIDFVAQHDPQADAQLASRGDARFPHAFLHSVRRSKRRSSGSRRTAWIAASPHRKRSNELPCLLILPNR